MHQSMQPGWGSAGQGAGSGPAGGTVSGRLTPGARITGIAVCAVLLGVEIAWVVRDIHVAGLHDTVWMWLGLKTAGEAKVFPATSGLDVALAATLVGALVAGRRPAGTWAYLAAGLFALVFRLSGLWVFTADWAKDAPLHDRALTTSVAFVAGGAALVLLALLGRERTVPTFSAPGPAGPPPPAPAQAPEPPKPATVAAIVGGLALLAVALETVGWQVYYVQKYDGSGYPPHLYKHLITGEGTLSSLLAAPFSYAAWITAVLAVLGAVLAFRRLPAARPLGLALGLLILLNGVIDLCNWHHLHLLFKTKNMPGYMVAEQGFAVFQVVAGLLLVALFAQTARTPAGPVRPGWPQQAPPAWQAGGQPPAWGSPYQQPPAPQGYQAPQQPPGVGGFGPAPELPPNLPPGTPPPPAGPPPAPPAAPPPPPRDWPSDSH